jgi:hypothetical protein
VHDTARLTGKWFFEKYGKGAKNCLDVGSQDVNGTLRDLVPEGCEYTGCDIREGPNVDMLLTNPYCLPCADGSFDLVVSTSCLEHDRFFWLTFAEMVRVSKGYIYISVPMDGPVHRYPIDCWRFYPDAPVALADWAARSGHPTELVESAMQGPIKDVWTDCYAVFKRTGVK